MRISVITLFPEMFVGPLDYSIIKIAKDKKLVKLNIVNLRQFGISKHKLVDDKPYGGGVGMVIRIDVIKRAIDATKESKFSNKEEKVILLSAKGKLYNQQKAKDFSKLKHLIIICGHYEGIDERITKYIDEEISIGKFILTGGEIAALSIIDSTTRLILGVLKKEATVNESFSSEKYKYEYPQYTRPEKFENLSVPKVLLSGDHKKIEEWKSMNSKK